MEVTVTDVFHNQPNLISGNPMEVEEELREHFTGALSHIPHGDLEKVLDAVNRMYGVAVVVSNSSNFAPPKRKYAKRPVLGDDPWVREIDRTPPEENL
jgi:hypothetical protein